ncbi:hypothetical protein [Hespellia stercorisuis]|uniref:Ig-like domain-containing protein n=1 Tax=Hespellia stercorisuis DSM 15480 TaxID=1121950 RepID=A0A1M6RH29_9FIRM|nr:hypothetical protein [Hespellia stercorisuis]SHK31740.1 hypothetical protein SAMN02745243_02698 [Hespellia stercorisuis DSM 15480]
MGIKAGDQITIVDVTDAYSVILTSEAYTFVGNTSGVASGATCTTQAVAFCGTNQCSSVSVTAADIACPTGISASITGSGTKAVTITFTTTATVASACEATIPVVVDGITVNKIFSFAVAKQGVQGNTGGTGAQGPQGPAGTSVTVSSQSVTYQKSSNGTTPPTGTWSTSVVSADVGGYLWTKTVVNYSDGKSTTSYSVAYHGTNGTQGPAGTSVTVSSQSVTYQASTNGTTAPTETWGTTLPTVPQGSYLWTKTVVTYSDGKSTTAYSVARQGANGEDAITMSITSSNGTVFKNNSGSTVLTAHVYKAGIEQTITDAGVCGTLGSVKWYKAGSTTAVATAKTLTVSASDVANAVAYTCQLEG